MLSSKFLCKKQTAYHLQAPPPPVSAQVVTSSVSRAALLFLYRVIGYLTLNILLSDPQANHRGSVPPQPAQEGVPQTLLSSLLVLEVVQGSFNYGEGATIGDIGLSILNIIIFLFHHQRYPKSKQQFYPRPFEIIIIIIINELKVCLPCLQHSTSLQ